MKKDIDYFKRYPLLPLRDMVIFPHMVIPLFVGRDISIKALDSAMKGDRLLVLAAQVDSQIANPKKEDIHDVGTLSEILQLLKLPDGTVKVLVEGISRVYISQFESTDDGITVGIKDIERPYETDSKVEALKRNLIDTFEKYIKLNKKVPQEALTTVMQIEDISHLADVIASYITMRVEYKQAILELGNPVERIEKLIELINGEIEIMYIEKKIQGKVRKQMEKNPERILSQ